MTENSSTPGDPVETDFLIAGAGPAGASLACFLTSYGECRAEAQYRQKIDVLGLRGIMISGAPGTAHTPRAHITNMAAMGKCVNRVGRAKANENRVPTRFGIRGRTTEPIF